MSHFSDFAVSDHGSVWLFAALTETARTHAEEMFPDIAPRHGSAYAVEHRYAREIVVALLDEGFAVTLDGRPVELRRRVA